MEGKNYFFFEALKTDAWWLDLTDPTRPRPLFYDRSTPLYLTCGYQLSLDARHGTVQYVVHSFIHLFCKKQSTERNCTIKLENWLMCVR